MTWPHSLPFSKMCTACKLMVSGSLGSHGVRRGGLPAEGAEVHALHRSVLPNLDGVVPPTTRHERSQLP